jgi:hypothetical protein
MMMRQVNAIQMVMMKMTNNNKLIFLAIPILLLAAVPNVYASGPRFDSPEDEPQEVRDCYRDGYETGFAHNYHKDRAEECEEIGKDWYNITWEYGCIDSGQTKQDCDNFKDEPSDDESINVDDLGNENMEACYDDGYEDGRNNPFDHDRNEGCNDYQNMYYNGFIAGCQSVEGNTQETCDRFTDA